MFKTEQLRAAVNQRLAVAAEEIFRLIEQTIRDYEEEVMRAQQLAGRTAPVQLAIHGEKNDSVEDNQDSLRIKEEQEEEPWATQAGEKQDEADTKETMFNIIYVQRSDEDGRQSECQSQEEENKRDLLHSNSSEQLNADRDREGCCLLEQSGDCQMSEGSGDEWTESTELLSGMRKPQQTGATINRPYTCNVCNKTFRIKSILTRHMMTHTGEKPYSCSVCGKSFIQRSYLQTHVNSHSGQKPYMCSFCGRGFTQVGNMNAHIRIHTGEKPHSCSDCGKSFREKADLIKHTIIHTGEKPYSCTVCNMKFSAQSNLTRHMKTHTGEKPYSCAACGKRFIRRHHLIIHMKTHTRDKS